MSSELLTQVWKLDRWGRSVADCIRSIQELVSLAVHFLAVTQNLDTDETNPMSRFLLHILAAFAELEREMIRERVRTGLRTARAKGKTLGRPRRVFRRDEAVRLRSPRRELGEARPSAGFTDVYGYPPLPFQKPTAPL